MAFLSLSELAENTAPHFDLCIIGSGPAGLSVASELLNGATSILVIESGGENQDPAVEALNEIENVGLNRAQQSSVRLRGLGGTSAHWTGRCGVLDHIDYEARPWLPRTGWPIGFDDVAPYFDRAGDVLELAPTLHASQDMQVLRQISDRQPWDSSKLLPVIFQFSQNSRGDTTSVTDPVLITDSQAANIGLLQHTGAPRAKHFGQAFRASLRRSADVHVLMRSTVTEILVTENGTRVTGVSVQSLEGHSLTIGADRVVLAAGGVENARLLLASRSVCPAGVGNDHDLVGRYLSDHPYSKVATYRGTGSKTFRYRMGGRWLKHQGSKHVFSLGLRLHPDIQRREALLNCAMHTVEVGDMSIPISLVGRSLRQVRRGRLSGAVLRDLRRAATHPTGLLEGIWDRYVRKRQSLGYPEEVAILCVAEQKLDPDSRITLSDQKDSMGIPRARIDWHASELEHRTVQRMASLVFGEMQRLGYELPRTEAWMNEGVDAWRSAIHDSSHPMGSTRMADNCRQGVVDPDCQVHGVGGLYVAGSSVFPTPGYVNPTQTIVALSLRLADHLKIQVKQQPKVAPERQCSPVAIVPDTRKTRIALTGTGDRFRRVYVPILQALQHAYEVVGFVGRSVEGKARFTELTGYTAYPSIEALVASEKPDLIIAAVSNNVLDRTVPKLVELRVPLLLETPFCWNLRHGQKTLKRIRSLGLCVGVAEQTPFLPVEQFKHKIIELGLIGQPRHAINDFAVYNYHGMAACRAYFEGFRTANGATAQRSGYRGPQGADGTAIEALQSGPSDACLYGEISLDNQTRVSHNFASGSAAKVETTSKSLGIHGTGGTLINSVIKLQSENGEAFLSTIERKTAGETLCALAADTPLGTVRWTNEFADHPFTDEQIAVATLLNAMALASRHCGQPPYPAGRAYQDVEWMQALRYSAKRGGKSVRLPLRETAERIRSRLRV